jgi:hypothetical protein
MSGISIRCATSVRRAAKNCGSSVGSDAGERGVMIELRASMSTATPPTEVLDPAAPGQFGPNGPRIRADPR